MSGKLNKWGILYGLSWMVVFFIFSSCTKIFNDDLPDANRRTTLTISNLTSSKITDVYIVPSDEDIGWKNSYGEVSSSGYQKFILFQCDKNFDYRVDFNTTFSTNQTNQYLACNSDYSWAPTNN